MKATHTLLILVCLFSVRMDASNKLSVIGSSSTQVEIQLQNTDRITALQFTLYSSSNIVLSNPERGIRVVDASWIMATYKPDDSTMNVLFINMNKTTLNTGKSALMHLTVTVSGDVSQGYIFFSHVMALDSSADSLAIACNQLVWPDNSNFADGSGSDRVLLKNNYPNPFNPSTQIQYRLLDDGRVLLTVYDILGREVARLADEQEQAGYYSVRFSGAKFASGFYFARLVVQKSDGTSAIKTMRMQLIK